MQTRTYGDLYKLIQSLAGVKSFAPSEQDDIANFINRRYFTAYSTSNAWPRYLVSGEERRVSHFVATDGYPYDGLYTKYGDDANGNPVYIETGRNAGGSQQNGIFVYLPATSTWSLYNASWSKDVKTGEVSYTLLFTLAYQRDQTIKYDNPWEVVWDSGILSEVFRTSYGRVVPNKDIVASYSKGDDVIDLNEIGEFIKIHKSKPLVNLSVQEYDFYVDEKGANIINMDSTSSTVFVTYKKKFTKFTTTSNYASSSEAVPEEFFSYIAHGAYADFLTMDGQTSKAIVESDRAEEHLRLQLEKVDIMNNNNFPNTKFSTYVNRQAR